MAGIYLKTVLRMEGRKIWYMVTFGECPSCCSQNSYQSTYKYTGKEKSDIRTAHHISANMGRGILTEFKADEKDIQ